MKFARAGYKEKIWDHAAGAIIIQEAGGMVTDAKGNPLDFSKGLNLESLDRGIVASAGTALHEKIIDAVDASWVSSCLWDCCNNLQAYGICTEIMWIMYNLFPSVLHSIT